METVAIGTLSFMVGLSRMFGKKEAIDMMGKDKYLFIIAIFVLSASFALIATGHNTAECFGLIGIVIGHFFGREMGKGEDKE